MKPIAVDAMGGDYAPGAVVAGAVKAVTELNIPVVLVGRPDELKEIDGASDLEIIEANQVISMSDEPGISVRRMKDSSVSRAAEAVRDGRASAMVSAGNTGAAMGTAILRLGRISGIPRPAIATRIPTYDAQPTTMLDCGANAECRPEWMVHFARMGAVYSRDRFGIERPRVGLLTIGEEEGKGNPLAKEAFELLSDQNWARKSNAEWIGNVEGGDIMSPDVDVIITDGFTGNVTLKVLEGTFRELMGRFLGGIKTVDASKATRKSLKAILGSIARELHPDNVGGAILLGVKGVCVISHGASNPDAVMNAIQVAHEMAEAQITKHIAAISG